MQYDFRSVYATVLRDWLKMNESDIHSILHPDVQYLPLIEGCSLATAIQQEVFREVHFKLYPNPATSFTSLEWISDGKPWTATMFDKWGHQVKSWSGGKGYSKVVNHTIGLPDVPAGHYYIHLSQGNQSVTKGIVIQ